MSDEYISKEKISDFFDGIYDCCDLVFQPNDHPCKAEDCMGCKFHLIKDALKRGVLAIPAAPVREVVTCGECKYFQKNAWETIDGVPCIVAHDVCRFWASGCKTHPDGYCFCGEQLDTRDDKGGQT